MIGLHDANGPQLASERRQWARNTGLWYFGLAVTGLVGYGAIRPKLYDDGDPAATLANLVTHASLARVAVAVELAIVVTQAMAAVMFYRLMRRANPIAAWSTGVFGTANALVILGSAVFMSGAAQVAGDASLAPGGDAAATVQLLYRLSSNAWSAGGLFFGLWLIPIGYVALHNHLLPRAVGWLLYVGGAGYLVSAFLDNGLRNPPSWLLSALVIPATIAELATIGCLITGRIDRGPIASTR